MVTIDKPIDHELSSLYLQENRLRDSPIDPLWTVEDVATYLKLQPETIRSMARRGELPGLKIGKVWRFQMYAIRQMLVQLD